MGNAQAIGDHLQMRLLESNNAQVSTVPTNFGASTANATNTFELDGQYVYGWLIRVGGGETYDVTLYPQLEAGDTATAFEPYRSMGGTVTPTEPLYGLPDAKDTVEVSTDGDVTVTRRTGYIASYSDESLPGGWISSRNNTNNRSASSLRVGRAYDRNAIPRRADRPAARRGEHFY